jgi:hypothetical protein
MWYAKAIRTISWNWHKVCGAGWRHPAPNGFVECCVHQTRVQMALNPLDARRNSFATTTGLAGRRAKLRKQFLGLAYRPSDAVGDRRILRLASNAAANSVDTFTICYIRTRDTTTRFALTCLCTDAPAPREVHQCARLSRFNGRAACGKLYVMRAPSAGNDAA